MTNIHPLGMTEQEAKEKALQMYSDCAFAKVEYGLDGWLRPTWQVDLWRNEECYLAGDPVRHTVQGLARGSMYEARLQVLP